MARCGAESLMMPRRASCSQGDSLFFLLERIRLDRLVNLCGTIFDARRPLV